MEENNYKNYILADEVDGLFTVDDILAEYAAETGDYEAEPATEDAEPEMIAEPAEEPVPAPEPESEPAPEAAPQAEADSGYDVDTHLDGEEIPGISEYELQGLVDSDEAADYAAYDPDDYALDEAEAEGESTPAAPRRGAAGSKRRRGKGLLSPVVAILALLTHKRSQSVKGDERVPTIDSEDDALPEMDCEKAAKLYGAQLPSLKFRGRVAAGLSLVMLYITFAFYSFLPLAGAMKSEAGASITLIILLLSVMLCAVDVLTAGILNMLRGRPGFESLASVSCILAVIDAAVIFATKNSDFGLPFCAVAAISLTLSLLAAGWNARALRCGFKAAAGKEASAVTAEGDISGKGSVLMRAGRGAEGFVRRSERADLGEYVYELACPMLLAAAVILAALASFGHGQGESFLHALSVTVACGAGFAGAVFYALPYMLTARRLLASGAALAGWGGIRDIGRSRGVVVTDPDIFPMGTVEISGIRVLEDSAADRIISYTGSVVIASGSGMAVAFAELMRRNGYGLCRVENFAPNDGGGLTAVVNGESVMVGNSGFMNLMGIRVPQRIITRNSVFAAINGELVGIFNIEYKPLPTVQDALGTLTMSRSGAVFAVRDFNLTPAEIKTKFHLFNDNFDLPAFTERFRISAAKGEGQSPVAAVVARDGIVPLVELSERGRRLHLCCIIGAYLAVAGSVLGLILSFIACWLGAFETATAAKAALFMLIWLLPNLGMAFWLER